VEVTTIETTTTMVLETITIDRQKEEKGEPSTTIGTPILKEKRPRESNQ
jgi:hypothetical protein